METKKNNTQKLDNKSVESDRYKYLKDYAKRIEHSLNRFSDVSDTLLNIGKNKGIVIVYAEGEDYIRLRGAINHNIESTMYLESEQTIKLDFDGTPLDANEKCFSTRLRCFRYCFNWSWCFKIDDIDFEIFNHYNDNVKWCQGIVFYLDDLKDEYIDVTRKNTYGKVDTEGKTFYPRHHISNVKVNYSDGSVDTMKLCVSDVTYCPIVEFKDKVFVLSWEDIVTFALKSELSAELKTIKGVSDG